jgi:toxin ParE1/3/4
VSLPVIIRPATQTDIERIHDDLEQVRAGLGRQFMARLREVLERIEAFPELYGVIWQDVQAARMKQFRYIVY